MTEKPADTDTLARLCLGYNIALHAALAAIAPAAVPLSLVQQKRRETMLHRLGAIRTGPVPGDRPVWVHALSVGEVMSAAPLVAGIRRMRPGRAVVFTTATKTGRETAVRMMQEGALPADWIGFAPYDALWSVRRMVEQVDPCAAVIVETDWWPNMLFELARRRIPVVLANGRMSDRSAAGYALAGPFFGRVLSLFDHILTQTDADRDRYCRIGAPPAIVRTVGDIKFDSLVPDVSPAEQMELRRSLGIPADAPVLVAGSTHRGEEAVLLKAVIRLKQRFPGLRLLIAPRNIDRAEAVRRLCESNGTAGGMFTERGRGGAPEVVVVNVIGKLKSLYSIADAAFVGGSLVRERGHNPLEPAMFAKPVLFGPDMRDFGEISRMLVESGGAFRVDGEGGLLARLAGLLAAPEAARKAGARALRVFERNRGPVEKTLKVLWDMI